MKIKKHAQVKTNFTGLYFILSWYITSISVVAFSLLFLLYLAFPQKTLSQSNTRYQFYQSLPSTTPEVEVKIAKMDSRALLVENFFTEYNAPLAEEAETLVEAADRYNLDFRLLPAIAMQESAGGKIIPHGSFNAWGYGIYGSKVKRFSSWEEAIETVARGLRTNYVDQGLATPYQIMTKYTPPSLAKGGPWAIGVSSFMEELR